MDVGFRQLGKMQEFLIEMASVIAETRSLLSLMFLCSSTAHAIDDATLAHSGGWQQPKTPQPEEFGPCPETRQQVCARLFGINTPTMDMSECLI